MKYIVLYEAVPKKIVSSFLEHYCIFDEFSNFMNGQVQQEKLFGFLLRSSFPHWTWQMIWPSAGAVGYHG
jgi:hypothetical protein